MQLRPDPPVVAAANGNPAFGRPSHWEIMESAIRELLIQKEFISRDEMRNRPQRPLPALGAEVISRVWVGPSFRDLLLHNCRSPRGEFALSFYTEGELFILEKIERLLTVAVDHHREPFPLPILGLPLDWFKATPYRARALEKARALLADSSSVAPDGVEMRIQDPLLTIRYLVLGRGSNAVPILR